MTERHHPEERAYRLIAQSSTATVQAAVPFVWQVLARPHIPLAWIPDDAGFTLVVNRPLQSGEKVCLS